MPRFPGPQVIGEEGGARAWSPGRVVRIVNTFSQLHVAASAPMLAMVTKTILDAQEHGRLQPNPLATYLQALGKLGMTVEIPTAQIGPLVRAAVSMVARHPARRPPPVAHLPRFELPRCSLRPLRHTLRYTLRCIAHCPTWMHGVSFRPPI